MERDTERLKKRERRQGIALTTTKRKLRESQLANMALLVELATVKSQMQEKENYTLYLERRIENLIKIVYMK